MKKQEDSGLDFSLKDIASILQTGKKVTRGTVSHLKKEGSDNKIPLQRYSEKSGDSIKSHNKGKDIKKNSNNSKKKLPLHEKKNIPLKPFKGSPNFERYIDSTQNLRELYYPFKSTNLEQIPRNQLSNMLKCFLTSFSDDLYDIKNGEIAKKNNRNSRDQVLVDVNFNHKTQARLLSADKGYVFSGQSLVFVKINFQEFKDLFRSQIDQILNYENSQQKIVEQLQDSHQPLLQEKLSNSRRQKMENFSQKIINKKAQIQKQISLSFVQVVPDVKEQSEMQDESQRQHSLQPQRIVEELTHNPQVSQQKIFQKFKVLGSDYILWPSVIYEPLYGSRQYMQSIVNQQKYAFADKQKSSFFRSVYQNSLFGSQFSPSAAEGTYQAQSNSCQNVDNMSYSSNQFFQSHMSINNEEALQKIKEKIAHWPSRKKESNTQLKLFIYMMGSNKFILRNQGEYYQWEEFQHQDIESYILKSHFKLIRDQIYFNIQKLNEYSKNQRVQGIRSDQIRNCLNRVAKCRSSAFSKQGKYNAEQLLCIPLRYSHVEKKVLVIVFKDCNSTQNNLAWVDLNMIIVNHCIPQIPLKNRLLLYFTDENSQIANFTLKELLLKLYAQFYFSDFDIQNILRTVVESQPNRLEYSLKSIVNSRCIECIYPIHNLPYYKCYFCKKFCHQQCSEKILNKSLQLNLQNLMINDMPVWVCDNCQPCSLCNKKLGKKHIKCSKCKAMFHEICGKLITGEVISFVKDKYLCENCIQCKICEKKLKNQQYFLAKGGYQCKTCNATDETDGVCHICKKKSQGTWIECTRQFCRKWIHKRCDKGFQQVSPLIFKGDQPYFCPYCRKTERRKIIIKCIQLLKVFDEYQYFTGSDYQEILDYKYIVQKPMCFKKMIERCLDGCYDKNPLQSLLQDFQLLVDNALAYNMPKDFPHYQARILNIMGRFVLQKVGDILECKQEQLIEGNFDSKINIRKKEIIREIYDRYIEIILNFGAQYSIVQVRKSKEKNQKPVPTDQLFFFSSRYILNQVFKTSILSFKINKKIPKIQNLFETQKFIDAFKSPLRQNCCYYHYWNSNVTFFCEICMQYYCCIQKCYRHQICNVCQIKGCACDKYECGCPPLKEKERKTLQKAMYERYYEKRDLTQNFKLCLKCGFERLNTSICAYCQKSYEYFYDFQTCKYCNKIYHRECADVHGSEQLSKYFFRRQRQSQQLFSSDVRLDKACYQCSTKRDKYEEMYQRQKRMSLEKLLKIHKISKFLDIFSNIYTDAGIKISLTQISNLIFGNYEEFLKLQNFFQEYRNNLAIIFLGLKKKSKYQNEVKKIAKQQSSHFLNKNKISVIETKITLTISNQIIKFLQRFYVDYLKTKWNQLSFSYLYINRSPAFQFDNKKYMRIITEVSLRKFQNIKVESKILHFVNSTSKDKDGFLNSMFKKKEGAFTTRQNFGSQKITEQLLQCLMAYQLAPLSDVVQSLDGIVQSPSMFTDLIEIRTKIYKKKKPRTERICLLQKKTFWKDSQSEEIADKLCEDYFRDYQQNWNIEHEYQKRMEKVSENHDIISTPLQKILDQSQHLELNLPGQIPILTQKQNNNKIQEQLDILGDKNISQKPIEQDTSIQQSLYDSYERTKNDSYLSSFKKYQTVHNIIKKYLLKCFEFNKQVYRRGNTCILKNQIGNWRVLKKTQTQNYQIQLKRQDNRWFFSINENTWIINSIEQMISKLKPLANLSNFRELSDFMGFTFRQVPLETASHFTNFLQTNPLDDIYVKTKKQMVQDVYKRYQWQKNGVFKKIKLSPNQENKEFNIKKKKPYYLKKRNQKDQNFIERQRPNPPYITYEDLKKDLDESQLLVNPKADQFVYSQPTSEVFIAPSPIHKLGLFAKVFSPKNTIMVQYIGQIVSQALADLRQSKFHFGCYMFGLNRRNHDKKQIIDATYRGNMARYLNHCCDPNCKAKVQVVEGYPRIFIYSIRDIQQYQELTYDYQFSIDATEKLTCTCGARNCQGRLN